MNHYFSKDENDVQFYHEYLAGRLPKKIIDAHMHINLPEHVAAVSEQTIKGDWAMECGFIMPYEDARIYHSALFPDIEVQMVAIPMPLREADIPANNEYLSKLTKDHQITSLMTIRPEWNAEYVEQILLEGHFSGFKPYPYMAAPEKGAEVSIFDFLTRDHLKIADRYGKAVLLHLPRKGRLADNDNVREIKTIVQDYPNLRLVIAHYGRCFNLSFFKEGLKKLGDDKNALYFDTAAVINPEVHREALQSLKITQILFGMDLPILLWHGKRRWTEREYFNLCREEFSWNTHSEPDAEKNYTFFVYEQCRAMLDSVEKEGGSAQDVKELFFHNANKVYNKISG